MRPDQLALAASDSFPPNLAFFAERRQALRSAKYESCSGNRFRGTGPGRNGCFSLLQPIKELDKHTLFAGPAPPPLLSQGGPQKVWSSGCDRREGSVRTEATSRQTVRCPVASSPWLSPAFALSFCCSFPPVFLIHILLMILFIYSFTFLPSPHHDTDERVRFLFPGACVSCSPCPSTHSTCARLN